MLHFDTGQFITGRAVNTNMLLVFVYLSNWYTHSLDDMLANECFSAKVWTIGFVSKLRRKMFQCLEHTQGREIRTNLGAWDIGTSENDTGTTGQVKAEMSESLPCRG